MVVVIGEPVSLLYKAVQVGMLNSVIAAETACGGLARR